MPGRIEGSADQMVVTAAMLIPLWRAKLLALLKK